MLGSGWMMMRMKDEGDQDGVRGRNGSAFINRERESVWRSMEADVGPLGLSHSFLQGSSAPDIEAMSRCCFDGQLPAKDMSAALRQP